LVTLTQVLVAAPRMTAAEALLRAQEKAALLAPTMGRQLYGAKSGFLITLQNTYKARLKNK
ncbi:MAG: hypothetical protein JHC85_09650, partial [Chthoniobacterales bacterium]|nr:hypothetical protein [Chthoniobacterales bacterium]